jgi:uncharacterized protein YbcI
MVGKNRFKKEEYEQKVIMKLKYLIEKARKQNDKDKIEELKKTVKSFTGNKVINL